MLVLVFVIATVRPTNKSLSPEDYSLFELDTSKLIHIDAHTFEEHFENSTVVAIHYVHTENETINAVPASSCCAFVGNRGHWSDRDMPVKVFASPDLTSHFTAAHGLWKSASNGIDLLGAVFETSSVLTTQEATLARQQNINTLGWAQIADVIIDGESRTPLATVTVWFATAALNHIIHYDMRLNSRVATIGDAVANPNKHDKRGLIVHEVGHIFGLGDLFFSGCSSTVMYGFMSLGDAAGRTMDSTTTACVLNLYGDLPIQGEVEIDEPFQTSSASCNTPWMLRKF